MRSSPRGDALFTHQGQPIHIWIHRQPDVDLLVSHELGEIGQVLGGRFGIARKVSIGLGVDGNHRTSQCLKQLGHNDRPRAANAVQGDPEPSGPQPRNIELR